MIISTNPTFGLIKFVIICIFFAGKNSIEIQGIVRTEQSDSDRFRRNGQNSHRVNVPLHRTLAFSLPHSDWHLVFISQSGCKALGQSTGYVAEM